MNVTIGRIVLYTLSEDDAKQINRRRTSGEAIASRIKRNSEDVTHWPIGAQAHIGNVVEAGEVCPMVVTRVWSENTVNGQVFLDGNDCLWATSTSEGTGPHTWAWPEQAATKQQESKQPAKQNAQPASQPKAKTQEDLEREKVDREREIMRDPHERNAEKNKKSANAPNPMPSYQDRDHHGKTVSALRIKEVRPLPGDSTKSELHFIEPGYGPVKVDAPWITANLPRVGGWFVVDGTGRRFMNAQAFEHRYRRGAAA